MRVRAYYVSSPESSSTPKEPETMAPVPLRLRILPQRIVQRICSAHPEEAFYKVEVIGNDIVKILHQLLSCTPASVATGRYLLALGTSTVRPLIKCVSMRRAIVTIVGMKRRPSQQLMKITHAICTLTLPYIIPLKIKSFRL